jgi:mannose-6-phosphate isomerase-like protein (cupin superfamily)
LENRYTDAGRIIMGQSSIESRSRRRFLTTATAAATAGIALTDARLFAATGAGQSSGAAGSAGFQLIKAEQIEADEKALQAAPGNKNFVTNKNFVVVLTTETNKSAAEFEWHEERDHIFQILEGTTVYYLGGTPKNGRNTKPGEWLAPESEGAEAVTLNKGDMLVVPRGTPHKRTTTGSVTFTLISPQGTARA